MIRNIIFDLGGVLVDFHPAEGMKKLGFSKETAAIFHENIFSKLWELCDRNPLSDDEIRNLFKSRVKGFEREVDLLWDNITEVTGVYEVLKNAVFLYIFCLILENRRLSRMPKSIRF